MRSLIRAAAVAAMVLALAACGDDSDTGDDTDPAAAEAPDTDETDGGDDPAEPSGLTGCDLLSADELAAVVGNSISATTPLGPGCSYEGTDLGDVYASFTTIDATEGDATMICESSLAAFTDSEPIGGLADSAYLETQVAELEYEPGKRMVTASVLACTERVVVSLALTGGRGEDELGQMAIDLTGTILDRV